ncbi:IS3 family transposase [Mesobacillus subterraneus]|uniref:IS3 family transposase n=2 Tax=Mesobacillus subterraneus TaxID=285983 RepID=A0A427TLJ3_9BACI|nr:IS3 family transposase [Mesobacillus subterraneus]RSD25226.1 IS3 family transposase [Mesobacillus subterraneus]
MGKYLLETKIAAVHAYLDNVGSYKDIALEYNVDPTMLVVWVALFREHGLAGFQESYTNYSIEFKMDVLTYMNETGASTREASAEFNIPSPSTVWKWQNIYETQGIDALLPKKKGRLSMKKEPKKNLPIKGSDEELIAENERLRMENAYLKKLHGLNSGKGKVTVQEKAQIVYELRHDFKVTELVKMAEIKRSTYYYWVKQMKQPDKYEKVKEVIQHIFDKHKGRYGYRRITLELRNKGFTVNHKTVLRLMKGLGLKSLVRMKKYRSYRGKVGKIAPNLLERDFQAEAPNEKWVTDVTEFHLFGEKLYLSPVLDLYNGEIIAYQIEKRPVYSLVSKMLDKAFERLGDKETPILHSDQGWQYQMNQYQHALKQKRITQSMSRKGNCLDNAVMENFFGLLKSELLYLEEFESMEHFIQELEKYIYYYNHDRIKAKLKGKSPVQYRTLAPQAA